MNCIVSVKYLKLKFDVPQSKGDIAKFIFDTMPDVKIRDMAFKTTPIFSSVVTAKGRKDFCEHLVIIKNKNRNLYLSECVNILNYKH